MSHVPEQPGQTDPQRDQLYEQFTSLLVTHQPAVLGYIRSLIHDPGDAEDVLQKTCLIAWQKFDQYDPKTKFTTWACKIAYFEVKNALRTLARDRHVFSDEVFDSLAQEGPREVDRLEEERKALAYCIELLASDERSLLREYYGDGESVKHLAEMLQCSSNSIYKKLNRVRRRLLACVTHRVDGGGAA